MFKLALISLVLITALLACSSSKDDSNKSSKSNVGVQRSDSASSNIIADTARGPLKVVNENYNLSPDSLAPAILEFDTTHISFDTLTDKETFVATYHFTNKGSGPLMIREAYGQCSCSEPIYPKQVIMPGEQGFVKVTFNSQNKSGRFFTQVIIFANTFPELNVLSLGGFITNKK